MVDQELEAGQLATARLLLLISAGPAGEKEEATISSVDATQRSGSGRASALLLLL